MSRAMEILEESFAESDGIAYALEASGLLPSRLKRRLADVFTDLFLELLSQAEHGASVRRLVANGESVLPEIASLVRPARVATLRRAPMESKTLA
jgi:hypothetical protein